MAFEQIIEKAKDSQLSEEFYSEVAKFLNGTILRSRKKPTSRTEPPTGYLLCMAASEMLMMKSPIFSSSQMRSM